MGYRMVIVEQDGERTELKEDSARNQSVPGIYIRTPGFEKVERTQMRSGSLGQRCVCVQVSRNRGREELRPGVTASSLVSSGLCMSS